MKSRHLHLWLGGAGALFLTPGLLWIAISGSRLKVDGAYIALQPLFRIPLRRISDSNLRERLTSRHEPARPQRAVTRQIAPGLFRQNNSAPWRAIGTIQNAQFIGTRHPAIINRKWATTWIRYYGDHLL
jgi:hypothetical protein